VELSQCIFFHKTSFSISFSLLFTLQQKIRVQSQSEQMLEYDNCMNHLSCQCVKRKIVFVISQELLQNVSFLISHILINNSLFCCCYNYSDSQSNINGTTLFNVLSIDGFTLRNVEIITFS